MSVVAAVRRFADAFRSRFHPDDRVRKVLDWLCACQTPALGGRKLSCACGWQRCVYNSCGNRHCPQCRGGARRAWLVARTEQLLSVGHFHVVATLPQPLRAIARLNPTVVYGALFRCLADTLQQFAHQTLQAELGIIAVLHTWRHDLGFHPHVHALVTAGGLHPGRRRWVKTRQTFLFPTRQLAPVFRGKVVDVLRAAFDRGALRLPGDASHAQVDFEARIRRAHRHPWHIKVQAPEGRRPDAAAKYLARYVQGPPISDSRLQAITEREVVFASRHGEQRVEGAEFVRRLTQHILPHRFCRTRYYGLYAPNNVHRSYVEAYRALGQRWREAPPVARTTRTCPTCGGQVTETQIEGLAWSRPFYRPRPRGPP